jgi:hypothetical protein
LAFKSPKNNPYFVFPRPFTGPMVMAFRTPALGWNDQYTQPLAASSEYT